MRVYKYNTLLRIPAPILDVKLVNPSVKKETWKRGKIDSGADLLVLPSDVVSELDLPQRGTELVYGYRRDFPPNEVPVYYVDLEIAGFTLKGLRAIEALRRDVLVGRVALNKLKIILDGKKLAFEISDPVFSQANKRGNVN
jgi:predicted aspartyl protease